MKKAVLILNGGLLTEKSIEHIKNCDFYMMCADGGYEHIKGKLKPDIIIGDFDSCDLGEVEKGIEIMKYPSDKDFTDGHLCVVTLLEKGFDYIEIYGATGGERSDHFVANFTLLALAHNKGAKAVIKDDYFDIHYFEEDFCLPAEVGKTVSIVPFTDTAHIKVTEGLKYPMSDVTLNKLHILAISNVAQKREIKVEMNSGGVLVFVQQ